MAAIKHLKYKIQVCMYIKAKVEPCLKEIHR